MPDNNISIPPAVSKTIYPSGVNFAFVVSSNCTVCFGPDHPTGSFPDLANQTFSWTAGSTYPYPVPASVGAWINYNTSSPGNPCLVSDIQATGHTISVGVGAEAPKAKAGTKAPAKAKKKQPAKSRARVAAKAKASAKTRKKSAARKKTAGKKTTKAKSASRGRTKSRAKARKSRKKR